MELLSAEWFFMLIFKFSMPKFYISTQQALNTLMLGTPLIEICSELTHLSSEVSNYMTAIKEFYMRLGLSYIIQKR